MDIFAKYNNGATVIARAGKDNQDYLKSLGADIVVVHTSGNVLNLVRKRMPNGVQVALDWVGGPRAKPMIHSLRDGRRFAQLTEQDVGSSRKIEVHHVQCQRHDC